MPGCPAWEGDTRRSGLLVAESEPGYGDIPGLPDIRSPSPPGVLVLSYTLRTSYTEVTEVTEAAEVAEAPDALPLGAGTPGKWSVTVRPPPGVSSSRAVPPLEVASRCTMARPSPVPFGLEVVNLRKARSRSSALMPGPLSLTVTCTPAALTAVLTRTRLPASSASRALAIRLSRICSRCPSPIQASTGPPAERPAAPPERPAPPPAWPTPRAVLHPVPSPVPRPVPS